MSGRPLSAAGRRRGPRCCLASALLERAAAGFARLMLGPPTAPRQYRPGGVGPVGKHNTVLPTGGPMVSQPGAWSRTGLQSQVVDLPPHLFARLGAGCAATTLARFAGASPSALTALCRAPSMLGRAATAASHTTTTVSWGAVGAKEGAEARGPGWPGQGCLRVLLPLVAICSLLLLCSHQC